MITPSDRFWQKVDKSGDCWLWMGSIKSNGYGLFWLASRQVHAHRCAWQLTYGAVPEGLLVLHRCDNRRCVNPAHLFLGTHSDNTNDMWQKERGNRDAISGERNHASKLTSEQVRAIRLRRAAGARVIDLMREYGVNRQSVQDIVYRRKWRWLD